MSRQEPLPFSKQLRKSKDLEQREATLDKANPLSLTRSVCRFREVDEVRTYARFYD